MKITKAQLTNLIEDVMSEISSDKQMCESSKDISTIDVMCRFNLNLRRGESMDPKSLREFKNRFTELVNEFLFMASSDREDYTVDIIPSNVKVFFKKVERLK